VRVVLDVNVIVSGVLSSSGAPARALQLWIDGAVEVVVSPKLLVELERTLGYPKIARRINPADAASLIELLTRGTTVVNDPTVELPVRSADPDDDYLIALAWATSSIIVSGDRHLLTLSNSIPVRSPGAFVEELRLELE
jgi:putative PIN family toxin of toxin-antitoxin system